MTIYKVCPEYEGNCRMVNLCKSHCVRAAMARDGWYLLNGEFVKQGETPSAISHADSHGIENTEGGAS